MSNQKPASAGISVVVPVYNSETILPDLIERIEKTMDSLERDFEIVLVNDGSSDGSWDIVESLVASHPFVYGINLMRNYGQHNAILAGIRAARFPAVVTLDDDLQNPPEEIPLLLQKLDEGYDLVYGTPQRERHGLWRNLASRATKIALQGAMGAETARKVSAYRAFRTQIRKAFAAYRGPFVSIDVLLTWGTTRIAVTPVRHDARQSGSSNYTFGKLIRHALNMMTGFSTLPLQMASVVGFTFTLFGIAILAYVLLRYLTLGVSVPGFFFLTSVIAIFSGAQLFALGIIGEYLARMHFRMMERPSYTIQTAIGREHGPDGED